MPQTNFFGSRLAWDSRSRYFSSEVIHESELLKLLALPHALPHRQKYLDSESHVIRRLSQKITYRRRDIWFIAAIYYVMHYVSSFLSL